ncbi:hypothetical protein [Streptomyces adustus]|uniref:hypothetical protein n=1 Tax=Streptomyces adustus TaxID=1609272 RepID=UPI00371C25D6
MPTEFTKSSCAGVLSVGAGLVDVSVGAGLVDASVGAGLVDVSVGAGLVDVSVGAGLVNASVGVSDGASLDVPVMVAEGSVPAPNAGSASA